MDLRAHTQRLQRSTLYAWLRLQLSCLIWTPLNYTNSRCIPAHSTNLRKTSANVTDHQSTYLHWKRSKMTPKMCGRFLCYARTIDPTMMHALNDLVTHITTGTMSTTQAIECFLNCAATHPNSHITFHASDMTLKCDSDAAYLVAPKARSRSGGCMHLGNHCINTQIINAPIMVIATILKMAVGSAAEAENTALYHCAQ